MVKPARVVPTYLPLSSRSPKPDRKSRSRAVSSLVRASSSVCVDGFVEEFGQVAAGVVDDLALLDWLAAIEEGRLHEGRARGVNFDFERNAEVVTVVQDICVNGWNARGAGVEVSAVLPAAGLDAAVGELDFAAVAYGPCAAAGTIASFDDGAVETGFAELVCGDETGDARAEDDDFFAFAEISRKLREERGFGCGYESEGLHGGECGRVAADLGHALDQGTTSEAHRENSACDGL